MGELSPWHWLIVIGVFVVLFGAQRLPGAARAVGQSLRVLKAELRHDDTAPSNSPNTQADMTALPDKNNDSADHRQPSSESAKNREII